MYADFRPYLPLFFFLFIPLVKTICIVFFSFLIQSTPLSQYIEMYMQKMRRGSRSFHPHHYSLTTRRNVALPAGRPVETTKLLFPAKKNPLDSILKGRSQSFCLGKPFDSSKLRPVPKNITLLVKDMIILVKDLIVLRTILSCLRNIYKSCIHMATHLA